ncbi:T9SS type A sorting domain-containing protein [Epilithonimonas pallida]|uniref:Por secretion system C-terminal sorting domain-containing protein n=1 Tax=Epilithonimonas pallida TaxID=373671 RepID=A0ABY1R1U2_9FLAO|nr:T9SS type A sorting domain-containing protein [Epilithonimonas pallida]SMP90453.1 Por secretion system C-terminal sorting domain-containing protein [Epilithonimonas pallida]
MKKLFISMGMLAISLSYAQKVSWQKNIDSGTQDFLSGLAVTIDGQYLVSGSSIQTLRQVQGDSSGSTAVNPSSTHNQNKGYDYHILKLDQQGQKVWEKYFSGNQHDYLSATVSTREGGFLLAGTSYSSLGLDKKDKSNGSSDIWLIKIDENGEEQWQKTIGTRYSEEARSVTQTTDEGYIVAGSTNHPKSGYGSKDVLVIKLDKKGRIISQLILGGKGLDEVEKVIPTKDGGVLMGIYSRSGAIGNDELSMINDKRSMISNSSTLVNVKNGSVQNNGDASAALSMTNTQSGNSSNVILSGAEGSVNYYPKTSNNYGEGDYWIVKLDKNASVQWEKNFGGSEDDHVRTMALTDSGYIIGGESRSETSGNKRAKLEEGTDLWVLALDEDGNEQWQHSYNFKNRDVMMSLNTIRHHNVILSGAEGSQSVKGFLIGGYTQSEGKIEKNDETFWMLYIDWNGKEVWRKYVEGRDKKKEERLTSALLNRDGSYILAGTSAEELGKENWKVVKLEDKQIEDLMENRDIQIYPNPVKDYCYVEIGLDFESADVYVYDMTGKVIQTFNTKNRVTKIDTSKLPQGVYIIKASIPTQQNKKLTAKIVKE